MNLKLHYYGSQSLVSFFKKRAYCMFFLKTQSGFSSGTVNTSEERSQQKNDHMQFLLCLYKVCVWPNEKNGIQNNKNVNSQVEPNEVAGI